MKINSSTSMKTYIFDIKIDTTAKRFNSIGLDTKLRYIAKKAKSIAAAMARTKGALAVLVAPEYFFAQYYPNLAGVGRGDLDAVQTLSRYYSKDEYTKIVTFFCGLSEEFPRILFVPGTISWGIVPDHGTISVAEASAAGGAPVPDDAAFSRASLSMASSVHRTDRGGSFALSVEDAARRLKIPAIESYEAYLAKLGEIRTTLVYNSACFYYQGSLVHQYDKQCSFQEVIGIAGRDEVDPPGDSAPVFRLNLNERGDFIVIGVEICFDHQFDVLKEYCKSHGYGAPHIHFLLSAYTPSKYCYVQNNGVFIHSSSCNQERIAFTQSDGRLTQLPNIDCGELSYYDVSDIEMRSIRLAASPRLFPPPSSLLEEYAHPLGDSMLLPREGQTGRSTRADVTLDAFGRIDPGIITRF